MGRERRGDVPGIWLLEIVESWKDNVPDGKQTAGRLAHADAGQRKTPRGEQRGSSEPTGGELSAPRWFGL